MFTVKNRVYGKAADGRTILLYTPGMTITDDAAKARRPARRRARQGRAPARGLTISEPGAADDTPQPRSRRSRA